MRPLRILFWAALLGMALAALAHRSAVQEWLTGAGKGVRRLVGTRVPELPPPARTPGGDTMRLARLRGRVLLLHFWTYG
jgi:hypothetical protein